MKVKAIISSIIVFILVLLCGQVNAAIEATVTGESVIQVKPGDKIEYKLKIKPTTVGQGIEGIVADIEYSQDILSLATSDDVMVMEGMLIVLFDETIKAGEEKDINLSFTVNSNTTATEAIVKFSNITLTDADQTIKEGLPNVETKIEIQQGNGQPTEKKLEKIEIVKAPMKKSYKVGERLDLTGLVVIATYSDGTMKEVTNYSYAPTGELGEDDTIITITYTENGITKTAEQEIEITNPQGGTDDDNDGPQGGTDDDDNDGSQGGSDDDNDNNGSQGGSDDDNDNDGSQGGTNNNNSNGGSQGGTNNNNSNGGSGNNNSQGGQNNNKPTQDNTTAGKDFVDTGLEDFTPIAIVLLSISSVVGYVQYRKNKQI